MHRFITKRGSLALRLALWYGCSAFLLLVVGTAFLYLALVEHLRDEDDSRLLSRINHIQSVLERDPLDRAALQRAVEVEVEVRNLEPVLIRVKDESDNELAATTGMNDIIPVGTFLASEARGRAGGNPYMLMSPAKGTYRAISRELRGGDGRVYWLHLAVDHSSELKVMSRFRQRAWAVIGAGLVGSALIGYWIARRGLMPIARMVDLVGRVRATTLHERITNDSFPAELSVLAATFNRMLQHLEDSFERLSRYSADIAHELRTPVNNLRGEAEVALSRSRQAHEYREVLGSSLEECARLSMLIDSLLFLARAENPQTQIIREAISVNRELSTLAEFYTAAAETGHVALTLECDGDLTLDADRHLFQRALGNLVENALKHTPPGGSIRVQASLEGENLRVNVNDTGRGIPAEHLPHVFGRFYRVDSARAKGTGGHGLGLAIVKSIAQLHGGSISVGSQVGKGTRMTLLFPGGKISIQEYSRRSQTAVVP